MPPERVLKRRHTSYGIVLVVIHFVWISLSTEMWKHISTFASIDHRAARFNLKKAVTPDIFAAVQPADMTRAMARRKGWLSKATICCLLLLRQSEAARWPMGVRGFGDEMPRDAKGCVYNCCGGLWLQLLSRAVAEAELLEMPRPVATTAVGGCARGRASRDAKACGYNCCGGLCQGQSL